MQRRVFCRTILKMMIYGKNLKDIGVVEEVITEEV